MKKAFTLIELLIVIAILAILAIAVLAAIDPVEQFSRGKDTGIVTAAEEYKRAADRYYTARNGSYPPQLASYVGPLYAGAGITSINEMVSAGELKSSFTSGDTTRLTSVILNAGVGPVVTSLTVCAQLYSKSFRGNTNALYSTGGINIAGSPGCPNAASSACSICFF